MKNRFKWLFEVVNKTVLTYPRDFNSCRKFIQKSDISCDNDKLLILYQNSYFIVDGDNNNHLLRVLFIRSICMLIRYLKDKIKICMHEFLKFTSKILSKAKIYEELKRYLLYSLKLWMTKETANIILIRYFQHIDL